MKIEIIIGIIAAVLLCSMLGLILYFRSIKITSVNTNLSISNPNYIVYQEMETNAKKRDDIRKLVPTYVSKDIYKDISNRNDVFLNDYFYLLDLALRCYYDNTSDISNNLKNNEKYIPVLVFCKFIVDYDSYVRDIPKDTIKNRFASLYGDRTEGMKFLDTIATDYEHNKDSFNHIIFEKYYKHESNQNIIPKCIASEPVKQSQTQPIQASCNNNQPLACKHVKQYLLEDIYKNMSKDKIEPALKEHFNILLTSAINNLDKSIPISLENNKFIDTWIFAKYVIMYDDYITRFDDIVQIKDNIDSFDTIMSFVSKSVLNYNSLVKSINNFLVKNCGFNGINSVQSESHAMIQNMNMMSADGRNTNMLDTLINLFKTAISTLITNKTDLFKRYQTRNSDTEFLRISTFKPVLEYAKFIEDNKAYLNQIDPTAQKAAFSNLYQDFLTSDKFYVNGMHLQLFILLASNIYLSYPDDVNKALL